MFDDQTIMGARRGLIHHYLREYMSTINEHCAGRELKHLQVNASVHSSTPAEFEAKLMNICDIENAQTMLRYPSISKISNHSNTTQSSVL